MRKDPRIYIAHMLDAIQNIEVDIEQHSFDSFRSDRRARQLVERNIEVISEASRRVPDEWRDREPNVPWKYIAGIGNVIRHDYHTVLPAILWETCKKDLKPLKEALTRLKRELERNGNVVRDDDTG